MINRCLILFLLLVSCSALAQSKKDIKNNKITSITVTKMEDGKTYFFHSCCIYMELLENPCLTIHVGSAEVPYSSLNTKFVTLYRRKTKVPERELTIVDPDRSLRAGDTFPISFQHAASGVQIEFMFLG